MPNEWKLDKTLIERLKGLEAEDRANNATLSETMKAALRVHKAEGSSLGVLRLNMFEAIAKAGGHDLHALLNEGKNITVDKRGDQEFVAMLVEKPKKPEAPPNAAGPKAPGK